MNCDLIFTSPKKSIAYLLSVNTPENVRLYRKIRQNIIKINFSSIYAKVVLHFVEDTRGDIILNIYVHFMN